MITKRFVIGLGLGVLVLVIGFVVLTAGEKVTESEISLQEKELIEVWIEKNNLNQYGDSQDTVYIGGTPLFNEKTGERIDKYEYILKNHSERPWIRK